MSGTLFDDIDREVNLLNVEDTVCEVKNKDG